MRFAVLGPVRAGSDGELREIGGAMPRTILAVLLLNANAAVPTDLIFDALWEDRQPKSAAASLYNHITRLRRTLGAEGGARITAGSAGYLIRVEPGELDLDTFTRLCAAGASAARSRQWDRASAQLTAALELWRGEPAADAPGALRAAPRIRQLTESRLQAIEDRFDAELALGRHGEALRELRALTVEHPLRESFSGQLMLALYRAGRSAEAIDVFESLRCALVEEVGMEPSAAVHELHDRILRADPALADPGGAVDRASVDHDRSARRSVSSVSSVPSVRSVSSNSTAAALPLDAALSLDAAPASATDSAAELETGGRTLTKSAAPSGPSTGPHSGPPTDTSASAAPTRAPDATPTPPTPLSAHLAGTRFELPADTPLFTGRDSELKLLAELGRTAPAGTEAGMSVLCAIDGMAGVGKTTVALRAAHRMRDDFPDGLHYLDLRGYTAGLRPLSAGDALDFFLRRLGVPPQLIPGGLGERAAFYRDRLEGTRTLIILDNAAGAAQIRPLLPASPGCLVLVTSRKRLSGLDDAHEVPLGVLSEADAAALLHRAAGPGRVPAGHPALPELIELCGRLPLALRVVGARLRHRRALRIEALVGQLRDENARLTHLQDEERSLTAVFDSSYSSLSAAEQRLFRRLGLVPGPDFDAYAAAALAEIPPAEAEALLEALLDHNLLTQHAPGRYGFLNLIRAHARTLAAAHPEPAAERAAALERLLDYHWHCATAADRLLARHTRSGPDATTAAPPPSAAPELNDYVSALRWMHAERDNLLADLAHVTRTRSPRAVTLTAVLATLIHREGPWQLAETLHQTAAAVAAEHGDRPGEANALHDLAQVLSLNGRRAEARELCERALAIRRELGDGLGEANLLWEIGRVHYMEGDLARARELAGQAVTAYRGFGDRLGEANALCDLGLARSLHEGFAAGGPSFEAALALYRDLGNPRGTANSLRGLGRVRVHTGDYASAAELLEQALELFRELGDRLGEAHTLWNLGGLRMATAEFAAAARALDRAQSVYRALGQRSGQANAMWELGRVRSATGDYAAAAELLERASSTFLDIDFKINWAFARCDLGQVRHATGDFAAAAEAHDEALAFFRELGQRLGEAVALSGLGRARHATGDLTAAAELLKASLEAFRELTDRQGESAVLKNLGALTADTAGPGEALPLFRESIRLAREVRSPLDEARALEGAARCLARLGERECALRELQQAVALYQRIGAAEAPAAAAYLAALEREGGERAYEDRENRDREGEVREGEVREGEVRQGQGQRRPHRPHVRV